MSLSEHCLCDLLPTVFERINSLAVPLEQCFIRIILLLECYLSLLLSNFYGRALFACICMYVCLFVYSFYIFNVVNVRDAQIRHWLIISQPIIGAY